MSETTTDGGTEEAQSSNVEETIDSTKTVVVAEEVHKALRYLAAEEGKAIKEIVDEELRDSERIQGELELLREMGKLDDDE